MFWVAVILVDGAVLLLGYAIYKYATRNSKRIDPLADCVADCVGKRATEEGYGPEGMPTELYHRLHAECWAKCLNPSLTNKILEKNKTTR